MTDYECQQLDMKQALGLEFRQAMEGAQQRIAHLKAEHARQKREFVSLSTMNINHFCCRYNVSMQYKFNTVTIIIGS